MIFSLRRSTKEVLPEQSNEKIESREKERKREDKHQSHKTIKMTMENTGCMYYLIGALHEIRGLVFIILW